MLTTVYTIYTYGIYKPRCIPDTATRKQNQCTANKPAHWLLTKSDREPNRVCPILSVVQLNLTAILRLEMRDMKKLQPFEILRYLWQLEFFLQTHTKINGAYHATCVIQRPFLL